LTHMWRRNSLIGMWQPPWPRWCLSPTWHMCRLWRAEHTYPF